MFDLLSQYEVANYETVSSKALCRHLGAGLSTPILLSTPSAFGKARAEGVGVSGDEEPPTKTYEALGYLVLFLISIFFCYGANVMFPLGVTEREPQ